MDSKNKKRGFSHRREQTEKHTNMPSSFWWKLFQTRSNRQVIISNNLAALICLFFSTDIESSPTKELFDTWGLFCNSPQITWYRHVTPQSKKIQIQKIWFSFTPFDRAQKLNKKYKNSMVWKWADKILRQVKILLVTSSTCKPNS